ncbi:hypothetical protein [Ruegeria sp.]|uniref:hypothetical protein n=1 Tax=Ruegeria sp. TaxID=1879320 RepID=UPI0023109DAE|nr:hypothetical protein [Ruegeria sp.]MDA7964835.1 hypothetical protein [Ruegeria sp.]
MKLLEEDGVSYLVKVAILGQEALNAAHPHFSMEDLRRAGDVPNIIDQIISVWSFELAHPGFDPATQQFDVGLVFEENVPAEWIEEISER